MKVLTCSFQTILLLSVLLIFTNSSFANPGYSNKYHIDNYIAFENPTYNNVQINTKSETYEQWAKEMGYSYSSTEHECYNTNETYPNCKSWGTDESYGYVKTNSTWEKHKCSYNDWHWDSCYNKPITIFVHNKENNLSGKILTVTEILGYTACVGGATVKSVETNITAVTDIFGFFKLENLPLGNNTIEVSSNFFKSVTNTIYVESGDNSINAIMLSEPMCKDCYTQDDINEAISEVENEKNTIIATMQNKINELTSSMETMYKQAELDNMVKEAVSEVEIAKNEIIQSKDITIAQLTESISQMYTKEYFDNAILEAEKRGELKYDINQDGKVGLEEIIKYLETLSGVRIESLIIFPNDEKEYILNDSN